MMMTNIDLIAVRRGILLYTYIHYIYKIKNCFSSAVISSTSWLIYVPLQGTDVLSELESLTSSSRVGIIELLRKFLRFSRDVSFHPKTRGKIRMLFPHEFRKTMRCEQEFEPTTLCLKDDKSKRSAP